MWYKFRKNIRYKFRKNIICQHCRHQYKEAWRNPYRIHYCPECRGIVFKPSKIKKRRT